ncbi:MAG: NADH-quinone oxidoreductase subunit H [Deltaproteobacteria bacterium]|nr:NADH-quinone oxidoreductase subunit H [Deltaproteobacteria bacterium]
MDMILLVSTLIKIAFILVLILTFNVVLLWVERRLAAMIQDRIGPVRAGIPIFGYNLALKGLVQPVADAIKSLWKEDFVPPNADKFLHAMAPLVAVIPVIVAFAVIPFGSSLYLNHAFEVLPPEPTGRVIPLQVATMNFGILFVFAMGGTGVVGSAIAGYSSNNKFSLVGGLRAAGQMVSYEVALGLSLVGCFMLYNTLLIEDMVRWQIENVWGIFLQPIAFILFLTGSTAEMKRVPFDVPEAEAEIVGGFVLEYSGMKFAIFKMGEYFELVLASAVIVVLFLGGHHLPGLTDRGIDFLGFAQPLWHGAVVAIHLGVFLVKLVLVLWLQFMIRWTIPRFRYDQIMKLSWRYMLPLALLNIFVTGVVIMAL